MFSEMIPNQTLARKVGCAASVNIWEKSVEYDELTINERQKNDPQYSRILNEVRCGYVSEEMICAFKNVSLKCQSQKNLTNLSNSANRRCAYFQQKRHVLTLITQC